jgi:hypothetical protein
MPFLRIPFTALLLVALLAAFRSTPPGHPADEAAFARSMAVERGGTLAETALRIARQFEGRPYVAGTLERSGPEALVVNLREFDCWTFVENAVALAQTRHLPQPDWAGYLAQLQRLRYPGGVPDGYASRHHYFFGWLRDHERRGLLQMVTDAATARPYAKRIHFMTTHRALYAGLKEDADFQRCAQAEAEINAGKFYFIPTNEVKNFEDRIADGDLIGVTTVKEGLDVTHEGFAVRQHNRVYLLHASSEHRRVMVSPVPLADYLARNRQQSGIVVARLMN